MSNASPKRASIDSLARLAEGLGYRVHEYEPFPSKIGCEDPVIQLDLTGFGELFEARFIQYPQTGYWRWWRGFSHDNSGGGTPLARLRDLRYVIASAAR